MGQEGEVIAEGGESNSTSGGGVTFVSVEFEVYGHVQGIYIAVYTRVFCFHFKVDRFLCIDLYT